ncbi:MAG: hypothetical protein AAF065_02180 [Verrucomicrobiota bacterium]
MKPFLLLVIVCLSLTGCVTFTEVDWRTQSKYKKVAVVSTLGEEISVINQRFMVGDNIMETRSLPYQSIVKPTEDLVIDKLAEKNMIGVSVYQEMKDFDFINNFFPAEPMLRTAKIKEKLRGMGYDLAVVILPSTILPGDHNSYYYNEMGVYRWHVMSKPKNQAFAYFYLYFLDLIGEDDLRGGGGIRREPSVVSLEALVKDDVPLTEADWKQIEDQVRDIALKRVSEVLDEQFN